MHGHDSPLAKASTNKTRHPLANVVIPGTELGMGYGICCSPISSQKVQCSLKQEHCYFYNVFIFVRRPSGISASVQSSLMTALYFQLGFTAECFACVLPVMITVKND